MYIEEVGEPIHVEACSVLLGVAGDADVVYHIPRPQCPVYLVCFIRVCEGRWCSSFFFIDSLGSMVLLEDPLLFSNRDTMIIA